VVGAMAQASGSPASSMTFRTASQVSRISCSDKVESLGSVVRPSECGLQVNLAAAAD
jgi:hypothetical protein